MSMKGLRCPNCDSLLITFIVYWKTVPQLKQRKIDAFSCRKCGQLTEMVTRNKLPDNWEPKIEWPKLTKRTYDTIGQLNLDGTIQCIERTVKPVTRLLLEPTGEMIINYSISQENNNKQYKEACKKMAQDLRDYKPQWNIPDWYKYKVKKGLI